MEHSTRLEEFIEGIKSLEGVSGYLVWAYRVKLLLKFDEAWNVVERQIASNAEEGDSLETRQKKKDIRKKQQKAMFILAFTLSDRVLMSMRNVEDPAQIWATLKDRFEARSRRRLRHSSEALALLPVLAEPDSSDHQTLHSQLERTSNADLNEDSAQPEQIEHQRKKNLAMVLLVHTVADNIVPLIMDLDDPAHVWARLKFLFERPSMPNAIFPASAA